MSVHFTRSHILLSLFLITFSIFPVTATTWEINNNIISGLSDVGTRSSPTVFQNDSIWYLISGNDTGLWTGFNWTGSMWQNDSNIVSGLTDVGIRSSPTVFQNDSIWYLIGGNGTGLWTGFNWTGSMWQNDSNIVSGLTDVGTQGSPTVFQRDSIWYLISGDYDGLWTGFNWTGSMWQTDNNAINGLVDVNYYSHPYVFQKDSMWYLIAGNNTGWWYGFNWTGSMWQNDPNIVSGLTDVGTYAAPTVFQKDSIWHLISGSGIGTFLGYFMPSQPVINLLSQTPSTILQNTTGYLNISYGISHDVYGLNNTSVSFIFRNYDHTLNDANHSIRPPENDKCVMWEYNGQIMRAANRNESLNFENNNTITGGDIYTWSGLDENQTRLTIIPVNSTYTIVNINGTIHDLAMEQMWYLDRASMIESTKTKLAIHKSQDVLIKFWDAEVFKGNYDFIGVGYTDTCLGTLQPSDANPVSFYKLNASYDPLGGVAPLDSPYIVYMGSLNASGWVDHVYSLNDVNYVRGMINNSYVHSIMDTTEIEYLYFTSNTPHNKPYYINITNSASDTNRTFGETDVLWIGDSAPYTAHPYTPNAWFAFVYQNTSFDHKLYAAGASGLWSNSTLNRTYIGVGQFPPTKPYIDHFYYDGVNDYDMNGYYTDNFTIVGGVSTDPDGGTVTHNLTLHYASNLTLVAIINNTFTDADIIGNGVFAEIAFNSTPYLSDTVQYTLKLIATDDEGDTAETWLGVDFWLAERPLIPGIIFEMFILMVIFATGMMMYSFILIDPNNYTHVLAAFVAGIMYILLGFSVFSGIGFYGGFGIDAPIADPLMHLDQTGWVAMIFIMLGVIMILYAAVIGLDIAREHIVELEESTI